MTPELVADVRAELGEGPAWDARQGVLWWVDIDGKALHRFDPRTGQDEHQDFDAPVTSVVPRASGGLMLTLGRSFVAYDPDARTRATLASLEPDLAGNRLNDGKCDRQGRYWAGTMADEWRQAPGAGSLYRLDVDGSATRVLGDVTVSNGLAWALDDRALYYVDSPTQRIDRFRFDPASGDISERSTLATIPVEAGLPDGCAIDAEGYLWLALWGGSAVWRISPEDGHVAARVELPVSLVSSCAFGGPELTDLYITTAAADLTPDERVAQPLAGSLFRVRPGVAGLPTDAYRG